MKNLKKFFLDMIFFLGIVSAGFWFFEMFSFVLYIGEAKGNNAGSILEGLRAMIYYHPIFLIISIILAILAIIKLIKEDKKALQP